MAFNHTTAEAAKALRTSARTLLLLKKEGAFRAGVHYRPLGCGKVRPKLVWDITAVETALVKRSKALGV
jgi:hypothetical protein